MGAPCPHQGCGAWISSSSCSRFDELLFEIVSWFLFYTLTLWRVIRSPLKTMVAAQRELAEVEQKQFDDTIPPPLFLAITLIFIYFVELAVLASRR